MSAGQIAALIVAIPAAPLIVGLLVWAVRGSLR